MQKILGIAISALVLAALLTACRTGDAAVDTAAHRDEVMAWRASRLEDLLAPSGFLTLSGLYWLETGRYSFGSDRSNDVVFPATAAALIGRFEVSDDGIVMDVADGIDVFSEEMRVSSILIADDNTDSPVTITHGTLAWTAVKRDGRFAIRLRDYENPALAAFGELPYFDIDPDWRVVAMLRRYEEPQTVQVGTVIEGLGWNPTSPGRVVFAIDGTDYEIDAYESGERLFYVFGDATSRDDTYGAGRFLYSDVADENGQLLLDFNKAYSPPCAFNDFATCPVASPRNRVAVRIEAGEKYDPDLHYKPQH